MPLDRPAEARLKLAPSVGLEQVWVGHRAEGRVPRDRAGGGRQATRSALRRCRLSLMAMISISGVSHRALAPGPQSTVRAVLSTAQGKRRLPAGMPTIIESRLRRTPMWVTTATVAWSPAAAAMRPQHPTTPAPQAAA